jgi:hypothetical protein
MNEEKEQNQIQEQNQVLEPHSVPEQPTHFLLATTKWPGVPYSYMFSIGDHVKKTLVALTRMADWDFILEYPVDLGKLARRARVPREIVEVVVWRLIEANNLFATVIYGRPVWSLVPTEEWILYLRGSISWKEERRLRAVIEKFTKNGWRAYVRPSFWLTKEYTQAPPYMAFCPRLSDVPLGNN